MPCMSPDARRCGTCHHFSTLRASLRAHGFGHCAFAPEWRQMSRSARCAFNPARWSPAP
ncbi:hypothetical protein OPEN69S_02003 [Ottowia pentelensis]